MSARSIQSSVNLLLILLALALSACPKKISGGYAVENGKVIYYHGLKGMYTMRSNEVDGADSKTFEALDRFYGRDANLAYFKGKRIDGSDGASFKLIETPYTSDKNHVYYSGKSVSDRPGSFRILFKAKLNTHENTFATDGEVIFKGKDPFFPNDVDPESFEQVRKTSYFRDKRNVYTLNRVVEEADPKTFEVVNRYSERYSSDASNIFYNGIKLKGIDRESHVIIDDVHHRDSSNVYFATNPLSNDPDNFEILSRAYSKDSKNVFWRGRIISDDAANFQIFPSERAEAYAKDSKMAYWGWRPIEGAHVETFSGLNHRYAKDKNKVYFGINAINNVKKVDGADPASFVLVKGEKGVDARDKSGYFNLGRKKKRASSGGQN